MPIHVSFTERRFFAPEVIQTSATDCGPAALKCLLEGFGIAVSYGRLREACQTDVDGTSIDTLEDVAVQLGLIAEQTMVPVDHLLLPVAHTLPALVVTVLPDGSTHFVVAWRLHGPFIQAMDPTVGRRWLTRKRFLGDVYRHTLPFSAAAWRAWAGSAGFRVPLHYRLAQLGLDEPAIAQLIDEASEEPSWRSLAALDAAARMVDAIVRAGGLEQGVEARRLVAHFFQQARHDIVASRHTIPSSFWSVYPPPVAPDSGESDADHLLLRGAVLVRVVGRRAARSPAGAPQAGGAGQAAAVETPAPLSPDLVSALKEVPSRPEREILRLLRADGLLTPTVLAIALVLASAGVAGEAVLLQALLGMGRSLHLIGPRLELLGAVFAFTVLLLLLEFPIATTVLRMGRRLETRLRMAFLAKLPRLGDRYFHSRLTSDMTQRAHSLRQLRTLPNLGVRFLRLGFQLVLTAGGIIWLAPGSAPIAILATIFVLSAACITQPVLAERDMRVRTHLGALSRFYLDALLGLMPVHAHGAERALRREHESQLVEWVRASVAFACLETLIQSTVALIGVGFAAWILLHYLLGGGAPSGVLLLLYWTLNLPILGQLLAELAKQYPIQRNSVLRLLEPLGAPNEDDIVEPVTARGDTVAATTAARADDNDQRVDGSLGRPSLATPRPDALPGVSIVMQGVAVHAGGHTILRDINLTIRAGEHIAIVGSSGAGKSSLVGLLLGWHRPATGHILVDGVPLVGERLHALRRVTAWVDPTVHLWHRPLLDNLRYGAYGSYDTTLGDVLEQADLLEVLERLPNGLRTNLGEGGRLVAGGEGQRVRLGRALLRPDVRLAILDEPLRGLDRSQRRRLLAKARQHWKAVTLLCITHDVGETQGFARLVVLEEGRIVEDAPPGMLAAQPDSRYRALLEADAAVRGGIWESAEWRRLWLEEGRLHER